MSASIPFHAGPWRVKLPALMLVPIASDRHAFFITANGDTVKIAYMHIQRKVSKIIQIGNRSKSECDAEFEEVAQTSTVRKVHFKTNWAFKVIQGHPYWCRQKSRTACRTVPSSSKRNIRDI